MSNPFDCFTHAGRDDLKNIYQKHLDSGLPEKEAARKTILGEHEKLHNDLNDLKTKVGSKPEPYIAPDNSEKIKSINDEYNQKIKAAQPTSQVSNAVGDESKSNKVSFHKDYDANKIISSSLDKSYTDKMSAEEMDDTIKMLKESLFLRGKEYTPMEDDKLDEIDKVGAIADKLVDSFSKQGVELDMSQAYPMAEKMYEKYQKQKSNEENKTSQVPKQAEDKDQPDQKVNPTGSETKKGSGEPPEEPGKGAEGEGEPDATSIKNETTRLRREQLGLDKEIPAAKKEFGKTWDEAKQKIEDGYDPQDLVDELHKKARPLTDVENAILLHFQNTKELDLIKANEQINKGAESGDETSVSEGKVRKARLLDELQRLYDVNKAVGTENARGLSSRQMMVDRKYSLVNMLAEKRATANDGKPLSESQTKEVEELHKKIKETQQAFDEYVAKAEAEIKGLQEKILGKKVVDKKSAAQKLRDWADEIEKNAKGQTYASVVPITPKMIAGGMRLIADGLEKGEEVLSLIKKAIEDIKKLTPEVDEKKLEKELNSAVINSNIISAPKEAKQLKDYSGLLSKSGLDRKGIVLKANAERARNEFDIAINKDKQKNRTGLQKAQDVFVKWQRGFKLSNPLTMGKLMMAGFTRLTTTPLEDIVGGAYSTIMPKLAKGAIGEGGGLHIAETAKAYKDGMIEGMKDAAAIMSKHSQGKSNLDTVFGKLGELPPEAIDFFGQLHSATKAPFKRFAFERSLSKRLRRNIANGVDVSDPLVQTEILTGAYKDANRAIFMQDNKVATGWQNMVKYLETHDAKGIATGLQWLLPFVKIPTNIAAEIGTHVYGVPVGAGKLIYNAFTKGTENLTADEKDVIFRNLKKGTLGLAAMTLGYMNPQTFGGFYQPGEKRKDDEAKALGLKLFGVKIPAWFVESPIFQVMQIGATIRRVKDAKVKGEEKGIKEGVWAGLLGLADRVPMVDQPMRVAGLFGSQRDRDYYMGELAKSTVDPAMLQYIANVTDPADKGSVAGKIINPENQRSPKTIAEHIKSGIPGLRETVPLKQSSPFNEQDKKDPTFKYFSTDWGMELPNTVASSEEITDEEKGTKKKLSDYPQDVQDKYMDTHKGFLKEALSEVKDNGTVYIKKYEDAQGNPKNEVSLKPPSTGDYEEKDLNKLSTEEKAQVLRLAQNAATKKTKKELFNQ